jgi:hypothetical protein
MRAESVTMEEPLPLSSEDSSKKGSSLVVSRPPNSILMRSTHSFLLSGEPFAGEPYAAGESNSKEKEALGAVPNLSGTRGVEGPAEADPLEGIFFGSSGGNMGEACSSFSLHTLVRND